MNNSSNVTWQQALVTRDNRQQLNGHCSAAGVAVWRL